MAARPDPFALVALFLALPVALVGCEAATEIDSATVSCNGTTATFTMSTSGAVPTSASVFSQETGNPEPQYADEHDFPVDDSNELALELAASGSANVSGETVFSCPLHHGSPQNVMTYIYRVYNDGELSDCLAQGHDPEIALDDLADRVNNPSRPAELADCRTEFGVY